MTEAVKKSKPKTKPEGMGPKSRTAGRINWNDDEALAVALKFIPLKFANPEKHNKGLLEEAELILPAHRRRVYYANHVVSNSVARCKLEWDKYEKENPNKAQRVLKGFDKPGLPNIKLVKNPVKKPVIVDTPPVQPPPAPPPIQSMAEHIIEEKSPTPISVKYQMPLEWQVGSQKPEPVQPQTVVLGPLEMALGQMVEKAVAGSIDTVIGELRHVIAQQQEYIHMLLNAQHDSLMGYFDPEFKRLREVQAEYISGNIDGPRFEEVRVKRKRVLIVCTNNLRGIQNSLESKFNGIDFTFVDGGTKHVSDGGFYELVICNATNRPAVKDKLAQLHGLKVVYTDGGTSSMVDIIRKKFGI